MQIGTAGVSIESLDYLIPAVVSLSCLICVVFLPPYLKFLKKMQVGQVLREEGPASHAHKAKTPTAGGVSFIVSTIAGSAIFAAVIAGYIHGIAMDMCVVLLVAAVCGSLGLADDLSKVKQQSNKGLSEAIRLQIETVVGILFGIYLVWHQGGTYKVWLPLFDPASFLDRSLIAYVIDHRGGFGYLDLLFFLFGQANHLVLQPYPIPAVLAVLLVTFLVVATANSANMHDGMDGLAAGTSFLIFCSLGVMSLFLSPHNPFQLGMGAISLAAAASMLGFFCFNRHPAKLFMGDTGSLFIGGLMASIVSSGGLLLFFIPLSIIYVLETLSVLIQRTVFKLTKPYTPEKPMSTLSLIKLKLTKKLPGEGKRVFRMAPLHHHYEKIFAERGVQEAQVVAAFWVVQAIVCAAVLYVFNLVR